MAETGSDDKLKVFISYSRRDSSDFADELVVGLELVGFAPFLDRHDIAPGEKWEDRLGGLIDQADTVVFVVSPEAVKSERCAWEVERTLQHSKQLLPVVFKSVPEADIPEGLRERQFVRFDTGPGITRPLGELAEALRRDIDWIREHTRIGELASRWEARGHPQSLLLRGEDITAAQTWFGQRKHDAPAVTEVMRAFISASGQAEAKDIAKTTATQRRIITMQALLSAALVVVIIGLVGWINQAFIWKQWTWYNVALPYARSKVWPYVLNTAKERVLKPGESFKECARDCPEMLVIPAGSFTMGSRMTSMQRYYEGPQHTVTFSRPFAVSKYELTFADWDACVTGGGCNGYMPHDQHWGRGQQPVINVNWDDAQAYVIWLAGVTGKTYRLLSEAEYEYVARAGTNTAYPWGDDIKLDAQAMANCGGCGSQWDDQRAAPVGSFAPNNFGLYDVVGNVWQWTEDCWHDNYNNAPKNGSAWRDGNGGDCRTVVFRGGSWCDSPEDLRSAKRGANTSDARFACTGFRIGRTLSP